MPRFDITPFALPNCGPGEVRFEQPRDLERVTITCSGPMPAGVGLSYLQKTWPQARFEEPSDLDQVNPCHFGWKPIDDWFNATWRPAATQVLAAEERRVTFGFAGLRCEYPELPGVQAYDVHFRRTLGLRVDGLAQPAIVGVQVYTTSPPLQLALRVELDAGVRTPGRSLTLYGYNATVTRIRAGEGVTAHGRTVRLTPAAPRRFELDVRTMQPGHRYTNDDGLLTFGVEQETFTVSLPALLSQGPIWFAEQGLFITLAGDATTFVQYRERTQGSRTLRRQVSDAPEQSLAGACHGQPRPHAVAYTIGCKLARQRFWLEPNGDLVLHQRNVTWTPGKDSGRFRNDGNARVFFDLGDWIPAGRFTDPAPVLAYNLHLKHDQLTLEQKCFAVPLERPITALLPGDDTIVAMVRFTVTNTSDRPALAQLPVSYSQNSGRSTNRLNAGRGPCSGQDDHQVPLSPRVPLTVCGNRLASQWHGTATARCAWASTMTPTQRGNRVVFTQTLEPGQAAQLVLKVPFVSLDSAAEEQALDALDFDTLYPQVQAFWRAEAARGAQVHTPIPHLNALYAMHQAHVSVTDFAMPDDPKLVNTSVGASTYGNFTNESCMIVEELDQRGLHEEAGRRIALWLRYQGTVGLNGRFSDHDGVFYGAGGFEQGQSYCQHHGWVLWLIGRHYLLTRDDMWLGRVADRLIAGCDWVFRQRQQTRGELPHSRGWERGFLPAGGLEDVTDYCYWLSTNALTWRGCDTAAAALEACGHPDARRIRHEANAYRDDLLRGFEIMRQHAPLVRLRDGRWVPHYPSRLYCRGRDYGWIRETLEGAVYLLISGLYAPDSPQAGWILDDFLDNRYQSPPFGYALGIPEREWFDRGGLSIQPNLLAGLLPHLDRDEIEVYLWMFFNCWAACYREEITAMVEHPHPVLGFSNSAHYKTSDEANAVKWLQYLFVCTVGDTLHLGRAIPRAWLRDGSEVWAEGLVTRFGPASVRYRSEAGSGRILATAQVPARPAAARVLLRFRHPDQAPIRAVRVNAQSHSAFDPRRGDVDVTGLTGHLEVEAEY